MKICKLCGKEKEEGEFGKCNKTKSGLTARCKKCINERSKISKNKNREEYLRKAREYAKREFDNDPEKFRERHKEWRKLNPEKYKESNRKSCKKRYENNKEYYAEQSKKWRETHAAAKRESDNNWRLKNPEKVKDYRRRYPEKNKARHLLRSAIRRGEIVRPTTCSRCKEEGYIEGHHYDYSKPLDVIWLCKKCHAKEHLKNRE